MNMAVIFSLRSSVLLDNLSCVPLSIYKTSEWFCKIITNFT